MVIAGLSASLAAGPNAGRITGTVVSAVTGEPVPGAYVGVGDFGDSGGTNYSRHRAQGLHAATKTDRRGRFELDGLVFTDEHAYLERHPLVVTHPDFVRHDQAVPLPGGRPAPDLRIRLEPGARIAVTVVGRNGKPVKGRLLIRLEALDGHRFIPPGGDPHLSSFASSAWRKHVTEGAFTFGELKAGRYSLDAIRLEFPEGRDPGPDRQDRPRCPSSAIYHGSVANLEIGPGEEKTIKIRPEDHRTSVFVSPIEVSFERLAPRTPPAEIPRILLLSSKPGLLLWDDRRILGEHPRNFHIHNNAFFYTPIPPDAAFALKNFPPGSYSVFAGIPFCLAGARMDLSHGCEVTLDIPWREPVTGSAPARPYFWLDDPVELGAREVRLEELCRLLVERAGARRGDPRFKYRLAADPRIQDEKVSIRGSYPSVWDLLEALYLEQGWKVEEQGEDTLILRPGREHRP